MTCDVLAHDVDEAAVYAAIRGELRMEGGGEDVSLLDEDGEAGALGEDVDAGSGLHDAGSADVDELERAAGEFGVGDLDGAVDLASVGIALDRGIKHAKAGLGGVRNLFCKQDAASTGSEGGLAFDEFLERAEKAVALEKFQEGGGFTAGDDEAIDFGKLLGLTDENRFCSGVAEGCGMSVEIALDGEDADEGLRNSFH